MINLTIPVFNGAETLEAKVDELVTFLKDKPYAPELGLIISNNGSTDATRRICCELVEKYGTDFFIAQHVLPEPGKGRAIREAWQKFPAEQYWFMDLDLSTSLKHLDDLHKYLSEHDITIGSRVLGNSKVSRSLRREMISRGYNAVLDVAFRKKFSDAQCGFKGVNRKVVDELLPQTKSNGFFFDTELLILAERQGYSIKEIPVEWKESPGSSVRIYKAVPYFLKNVFELHSRLKYL
jgi:glycosyltransferase involved in cell wall biosynthesis